MYTYEITAAGDGFVTKTQCDYKDTATEIFKETRKNKELAVRTRVLDGDTVVSEKTFGGKEAWDVIDAEWNNCYKAPAYVCKINITTGDEEEVGEFKDYDSALNWIRFAKEPGATFIIRE